MKNRRRKSVKNKTLETLELKDQISIWSSNKALARKFSFELLHQISSKYNSNISDKVLVLNSDVDEIENLMNHPKSLNKIVALEIIQFIVHRERKNGMDHSTDFITLIKCYFDNNFDTIYLSEYDLAHCDSLSISSCLNKNKNNCFYKENEDMNLGDFNKHDVSIECNVNSVMIHCTKEFKKIEKSLKLKNEKKTKKVSKKN